MESPTENASYRACGRAWSLAGGSSVYELKAELLPAGYSCIADVPARLLRAEFWAVAPDEVPGWDSPGVTKRGLKARMVDLRWARLRAEKERRRLMAGASLEVPIGTVAGVKRERNSGEKSADGYVDATGAEVAIEAESAGGAEASNDISSAGVSASGRAAAHRKAAAVRAAVGVRVVLDCGFDDLMTNKERASLREQVAAAICLNTRSRGAPLRLIVTSMADDALLSLWRARGSPMLGWPCDMLSEHFALLLRGGSERARAALAVVADAAAAAAAVVPAAAAATAVLDAAAAAAAAAASATAAEVLAPSKPVAAVAGVEMGGVPETGALRALHDARAHLPALLAAHFAGAGGEVAAAAAAAAAEAARAPWQPPEGWTLAPSLDAGAPASFIYLTADEEEALAGPLDAAATYIVGGIVDRNRHKGLTAKLAAAVGIRTARFPIAECGIAMSASQVLTTNHVVDILCRVSGNGGDWRAALAAVIPQRKAAAGTEKVAASTAGAADAIEKSAASSGAGGDDEAVEAASVIAPAPASTLPPSADIRS